MKNEALLRLARLRQSFRLDGYAAIGDFHDGIFECDHVSPWTKSGGNVDAEIMVVGQDWSSSDALAKGPPSLARAKLGFNPLLLTNTNLDDLLQRHFGLTRAECYLTNLFPYIKPGNASAPIPLKDLVVCAKKFTLQEIRIVSPVSDLSGEQVIERMRRFQPDEDLLAFFISVDPEQREEIRRLCKDAGAFAATPSGEDLTRILLGNEPIRAFEQVIAAQVRAIRISAYQRGGGGSHSPCW